MPAVHSKEVDFLNPKGTITDKLFFILSKYKLSYKQFKEVKCYKQLSFEARRTVSQFKMEVMSLGYPKEVAEGLHARLMK